jgi:hypothetical protein
LCWTLFHTIAADNTMSHWVPADDIMSHWVPADDIMSHWVPADDIMSHWVPADDIMSHWVPADDTMSHWVPADDTMSYWVPADDIMSHWVPEPSISWVDQKLLPSQYGLCLIRFSATSLIWLLEFQEVLRILDRLDIRHYEGGKVVTLKNRSSLPPGIFLVLIFRGWVDPRAHGSVCSFGKNPRHHWGSIPRPSD